MGNRATEETNGPGENGLVVSSEMHETSLDTVLADMASFPRTEPSLQKHLLISEHISHCLQTLMRLAATDGGKTKMSKCVRYFQRHDAFARPGQEQKQLGSPAPQFFLTNVALLNKTRSLHISGGLSHLLPFLFSHVFYPLCLFSFSLLLLRRTISWHSFCRGH